MARTTRTSNPVSLFPFLAVLMCTIGALILLLVVVTAQIRRDTVETAQRERQQTQPELPAAPPEPPVAPSVPEPPELVQTPAVITPEPEAPPAPRASPRELAQVDELNAMSRQLSVTLVRQSKELASARQKASATRQQLRLAIGQEKSLAGQIQQARSESSIAAQKIRNGRKEQQEFEELIRESDELIKSRQKVLSSPRFSIVPYDGQTGTIRRPIVIECRKKSLQFVAEGVTLDPGTLDGYTAEQNPLLAGVLALADYWAESDRASGDGRVLRPYPLLLVRPDGANSFEAARVLLDRLTGSFGYELIEDEFDFKPPETTDEAIARCRAAVRTAYQLRPKPVIAPPKPQAVDSSFVRRTPAASRSFFTNDAFRQRASEAGGSGMRAGIRGGTGGIGNGRRGSGPNAAPPGLFVSEPGRPADGASAPPLPVPPRPDGPTSEGNGPSDTTAKAGQPGGTPEQLPFDLINPPSRPGGRAANGQGQPGDSGTGPTQGTASNSGQQGPASSGNSTGPNASGRGGGGPGGRGRKRWGLFSPNATLELEQKVALIVSNDRIAVANRYAVSRKPGSTSIEMVNRTVLALEQVAREWGQPPERFFWVPSVTLGVTPDAGELGLLLARVLRKEGLEVKIVDLKN